MVVDPPVQLPMKQDGDPSPLIPVNYPDDDEDLALLALRSPGFLFFFSFFFFFLVVCVLGDLVCVSVKFFFPSTCACVWLLRKCGKEMGIWILVRVLKNLLNLAMFSIY